MDPYFKFHRKRYNYLLSLLKEYVSLDSNILDIGRSPLTALLYKRGYKNLTTLGFPLSKTHLDKKVPEMIPHIIFDLNDCKNREKWIKLPKFDLIIFAEVLEHLHVAPEYVMEFLKSGLENGGYIILQTPNAVSIGKRLKMLFGIHPFEMIRKGDDPGHIREYTKKELIQLGKKVGLKVIMHEYKNYFNLEGLGKVLYKLTFFLSTIQTRTNNHI